MNAIIFGATGQDGRYLTEILAHAGLAVTGVARHGGDVPLDVSDVPGVRQLIRRLHPSYIFHLAATSNIRYEDLWANHASISTGTLAILDAVKQECPGARVLLAGSAHQFINRGEPLNENAELDYSDPYTVARHHSLFAGRYFRKLGLKIYFAYLFHHDSPYRSNHHLTMKIAEAAARSAQGSADKLTLGDIDAQKEFNFAGDTVDALWRIINQEAHFEYVVGSGVSYSIRNWVELCYSHVGLDWRQHVHINDRFSSTYRRIVSDPQLLQGLGWKPRTDLSSMCEIIMEEALRRVQPAHAPVLIQST